MGVSSLVKGSRSRRLADVTRYESLQVSEVVRPADTWTQEQVGQRRVLSEYLTLAGSETMKANGSLTAPLDFEIAAEDDRLKWVTRVVFYLEASGMKLDSAEIRNFGGVGAALTNGLRLVADQGGEEADVFVSPVVRTSDFFIYADGQYVWGVTDGVSAGVDILAVTVTLPVPVGLYPGSLDRLFVQVRDNITSVTDFTCQALGWYEKLPE